MALRPTPTIASRNVANEAIVVVPVVARWEVILARGGVDTAGGDLSHG
jgi:hypothetical protein